MTERFKEHNNYKFDRWIFQTAFAIFLLFSFFVVYHFNFEMDFFECNPLSQDPSMVCKNPFYKPITWKNYEYLSPGVYGVNIQPVLQNFLIVTFSIFLLAFSINHLWHNKGKRLFNEKNSYIELK